ncbi:MAG: hypothetical protein K0R27_1754 [Xanthobacteraceae bacterium]|jgi:peptidoglycan/LPS O-acetylase OafA/YrhL|nr:hypothetical protein [Xanthobacteraceae bacterium]
MIGSPASTDYLSKVQILRFIAAAVVLFGHAQHEAQSFTISGANFIMFTPIDWGSGVDIFFIVSGFVMYYICHDRFGRDGEVGRFLKRRVIRVVPPYWLFTGLMIVATVLFSAQLNHSSIDLNHVLASLFFLPWVNPYGETLPFLILGWTLNYEIFFYICFAVALYFPRAWGVTTLCFAFAAAAALHPIVPDSAWMLRFWSDPIILEFLMGIALAALFLRGFRLSPMVGLLLVLGGFILLTVFFMSGFREPSLRFLWSGAPALLISAGLALQSEGERHSPAYRALVSCGTASYSLYLSHPFTINAVGLVWRKLALDMPWLFVFVTCVASIAASLVVYALVEKPLVSSARRMVSLPGRASVRDVSAEN